MSFTATDWDHTQAVWHMWIERTDIKPSGSVYALNLILSVRLPLLSTERVTMLNRFPSTTWPWRQVQRELCGTIFSGNVEHLRVSCYDANNGRVAWALFVMHSQAQEEWLRHNFSRVLTESFALISRVLYKQRSRSPGHYSLIKVYVWLSTPVSLCACKYHALNLTPV